MATGNGEGEGGGGGRGLDKGFGFNKGFAAKYDMGDEVGRGHFGYTCAATVKKGARKGESVAIKVIPKAKVMCSFRNALLWHFVLMCNMLNLETPDTCCFSGFFFTMWKFLGVVDLLIAALRILISNKNTKYS